MEFIGFILFLVFINFVWRLIVSGGSAAVNAARGQGSFSENMTLQWQGMGELEVRKMPFTAGEDGEGPRGIAIEVRGLIPVVRPTNLGFVTSVVDVTNGTESHPVLSELEMFQEHYSPAYQHRQEAGRIEPNQGFVSWARVGVVFPDLLYPPQGGRRKLAILVRLVDMSNMPPIELGFSVADHPGMVAARSLDYIFDYSGKGYLEAAENRDEARALAIRLGMAIAVADGSLDASEGNVIKEWITRLISPYGADKREELKGLYNDALRSAFAAAKAGELTLSDVTSRLNEIADEPQKYEAIELCFDVMAADGTAEESEMETIRRIAGALNLDYGEIENLRDKKLLTLNVGVGDQASLETMIGIGEGWSREEIKAHIRTEYAKWNDRLNNLPEGQERDNAQRMLDMLSEARKKYA